MSFSQEECLDHKTLNSDLIAVDWCLTAEMQSISKIDIYMYIYKNIHKYVSHTTS